MKKKHDSVFDTDPVNLARLLDLNASQESVWHDDELSAIYQHQLATPVQFDLGNFNRQNRQRIQRIAKDKGLLLNSFHDLLMHRNPPLELLVMVKDFAKAHINSPQSPLPKEIATILYYASITVARLRCKSKISKLTNEELAKGLDWALARPWLDDDLKSLFEACQQALNSQNQGGDHE